MENEDDLFKVEHSISASEDEDEEATKSKHNKLLNAIGSLDSKKRKRILQRTEVSSRVSEYDLNKGDAPGAKVRIRDLVGTLKDTVSHGKIKKQLNRVQKKKGTLDTPLPKVQADRIARSVAYEQSSTDISKWDHIVQANRRAEHISFPLNQDRVALETTETFAKKLKPSTPLEMEIYAVLQGSKYAERPGKELSLAEEEALSKMSIEEAKEHRAQMQKTRALQSYYEAKCRRLKKIKSKKFHRVLRKQKNRAELKKMEEMEKNDPEAYHEELLKLDKQRAEERLTLKHRNTGKWARDQLKYSKHNSQSHQALQDQLQKSKDLTEKIAALAGHSDDEEEAGGSDSGEDDLVQPSLSDINNPWFTGSSPKKKKQPTAEDGAEELEGGGGKLEEIRREADSDMDESDLSESEEPITEQRRGGEGAGDREKTGRAVPATGQSQDPEKPAEDCGMSEGLDRRQSLPQLDRNRGDWSDAEEPEEVMPAPTRAVPTEEVHIDPNKVFTVEVKRVKGQVAQLVAGEEEEEEDDQLMNIKQAFAEDGVVEDFVQDKKSTMEGDRPRDMDLTLPGWGNWGGAGIKPSRRKNKRFLVKAAPAMPRKDRDLHHVIINEKRDKKIAMYQVNEVPFPFTSAEQFEKSIRSPIGSTWNTPTAYQKLTKPQIETKMGTIIEPIKSEEAFKRQKKNNRRRVKVDIQLPSDNDCNKKMSKKRRKSSKHTE